jgi:hypothetical protein
MSNYKQMSLVLMNQAKLWKSLRQKRHDIERIAQDGIETEEDRQLATGICCVLTAGIYCEDQLKKDPDSWFCEN